MAQEPLAVQGVVARPWQRVQRQEDGLWLPLEKKKRLRIYGLF